MKLERPPNKLSPSNKGFAHKAFSPSSTPALANAFTTAAMVPDCPRMGCASKASSRTTVVM
jgi:hypothetical protein